VFFTPDKVWGMPPYYAQQMAAQNYQPNCVQYAVESPNHDLDVTATRSDDGKTLVLKIVNLDAASHHASITLNGFSHPRAKAQTWTLSGELTAVNTPTEPMRISPVMGFVDPKGGKFEVELKGHSYMVVRIVR
jgi:alpha-L-arabinofuranosidase